MSAAALALVLVAACLHAAWNYLAKKAGGGVAFVWLLASMSALIYLLPALIIWFNTRPQFAPLHWLFIAGTAVLHVGYFLSLQTGYRKGDLSLVYPLARGSGPLLTTVGAIVLLGERPGWLALSGIALIVLSVFFISGGTRIFHAGRDEATAWALRYGLLTGLFIAAYTLWDKYAMAVLLIQPLLFDWLSNIGRSAILLPFVLRDWQTTGELWRRQRWRIATIALLSSLSYILVLQAMSFTDVTYVAPAREVSILLAAFLGARLLHEGESRRRLIAACAMLAGVVCLALG